MLFDGNFLLGILSTILVIYLIGQLRQRHNRGDFSLNSFRVISHWSFDQIVGLDEARFFFQKLVNYVRETPRLTVGYLYGPEGSGKTTLGQAIASQFDEVYWITGSRLRDSDPQFCRRLLEEVYSDNYACLVIDLFDLLANDGDNGSLEAGEQLEALIQEIERLRNYRGFLILIGRQAIDHFESRIQAMIDYTFGLTPLDHPQRLRILTEHLRRQGVPQEFFSLGDWDQMSRMTMDMGAHDLMRVVSQIGLIRHIEENKLPSVRMFQEAVMAVVYGRGEKYHEAMESRQRVAVHEAGHAIVGYLLMEDYTVQYVTIMRNGQFGGLTYIPPRYDGVVLTAVELRAKIAMSLGSFAAEELLFSSVSSGVDHDIKRATYLATDMVCCYGMDDTIGPVAIPKEHQNVAFEAIQTVLKQELERARLVLRHYRKALEALRDVLLEREEIFSSEISFLLDPLIAEAGDLPS